LQSNSRVAILRSKKRVDDQDKNNRQELFGTKNGKSFTEQFELKQFGVNKR
jgi:protein transport protein SEC20